MYRRFDRVRAGLDVRTPLTCDSSPFSPLSQFMVVVGGGGSLPGVFFCTKMIKRCVPYVVKTEPSISNIGVQALGVAYVVDHHMVRGLDY